MKSPLRSRVDQLSDVFSYHDLVQLLGISWSEFLRYYCMPGEPPDIVEDRLDVIFEIVGYLRGSHNAFGVRRWFYRTRVQLDGRSPSDILQGDWDPDDDEVQEVLELAQWLSGPGNAT